MSTEDNKQFYSFADVGLHYVHWGRSDNSIENLIRKASTEDILKCLLSSICRTSNWSDDHLARISKCLVRIEKLLKKLDERTDHAPLPSVKTNDQNMNDFLHKRICTENLYDQLPFRAARILSKAIESRVMVHYADIMEDPLLELSGCGDTTMHVIMEWKKMKWFEYLSEVRKGI